MTPYILPRNPDIWSVEIHFGVEASFSTKERKGWSPDQHIPSWWKQASGIGELSASETVPHLFAWP